MSIVHVHLTSTCTSYIHKTFTKTVISVTVQGAKYIKYWALLDHPIQIKPSGFRQDLPPPPTQHQRGISPLHFSLSFFLSPWDPPDPPLFLEPPSHSNIPGGYHDHQTCTLKSSAKLLLKDALYISAFTSHHQTGRLVVDQYLWFNHLFWCNYSVPLKLYISFFFLNMLKVYHRIHFHHHSIYCFSTARFDINCNSCVNIM